MKRLVFAGVLVLAGAAISFAVLRSLLIDQELAGSLYETELPRAIASLVLGTITYVHQLVNTRKTKPNFGALPGKIVGFERYTLPWYIMIVYSVFMIYAFSGLGTIIIWSVGEITGFYFSSAIPALNTLFVCVTFYFIGSWIGSRCDQHQFLTTGTVVFLYKIVTTIIVLLIASSSILTIIMTSIGSTLLYLIVALIGLWRGRRMRLPRYLQYLLRFVAPDDRNTIVQLAYEEVKKLSSDPFEEDSQGTENMRTPYSQGA